MFVAVIVVIVVVVVVVTVTVFAVRPEVPYVLSTTEHRLDEQNKCDKKRIKIMINNDNK